MPATVWMQATEVTQATTVTSATSNINDSNIMTAHNSRNASHSRNVSNNRTANTVCMHSKAGMLAKTVKSAKAWREANSSRDNMNITVSTAEGRPAKARMPEIQQKRLTNNSTSISRDANSTIWTPITHEFLQKFAKKSSEWQKFVKKDINKSKIPHFFPIVFSKSDSYRTIESTM
jgi:hypothetical protein